MIEEAWIETPIGPLRLSSSEGALTRVAFRESHDAPILGVPGHLFLGRAAVAFQRYFDGDPGPLDALPIALRGTRFQAQVWTALRAVPFGETISYARLARAAGFPGAARAVGGAMARNPLAIVVPCHRVVASDGGLCGFGGGLDIKRVLLEHESAHACLGVNA